MKKNSTLILMLLFGIGNVLGAVDTQVIKVSTAANPEHVYFMHAQNNDSYFATSNTYASNTPSSAAKFAFIQAKDGNNNVIENAYYIYCVDTGKWMSYDKSGSYSAGKGFVKMVGDDPNYFCLEHVTTAASSTKGYRIRPYYSNGNLPNIYLNWYEGASSNTGNSIGLWTDDASADAGSGWAFIEVPRYNHFYRIKSNYNSKYLVGNNANGSLTDNTSTFYYSEEGLLQISSGKYYDCNSKNVGTTAYPVTIEPNAYAAGTLQFKTNGYWLYNDGTLYSREGESIYVYESGLIEKAKWYGARYAWHFEELSLDDLRDIADELYEGNNAGKLGYHSLAANNALVDADDVETLTSAIVAFKASAIVMPEVGKKYAFMGITSKNNYMLGQNSTVEGKTDRMEVSQTVSYPNYIFTLQQGNKLQASNGNYVINYSGMLKLGGDSQSDAVEITFVPATTSGTFFLNYKDNSKDRYAYSDKDGYIDGGGSTGGDLGYEWKIEELVMPESGKAYRVKNVQKDGTVYYLCNTENNLSLTSNVSGANTTFIFREVGDFVCSGTTRGKKYAVVNEYGKYLAYRTKITTSTPKYAETGYSDSYVENETFWAFAKIGTRTNASLGNITADDSFGRLCIGCYRSDTQSGKYGFLVIANNGTFDAATNTTPDNGTYFKDNYSSLFELEEITDYTANQVSLKAPKKTDGKTYSSIYLPYPVKVPEGVTAYYCTLNENSLHLEDIGEKIPAQTGAILIGGTEASTQTLVPATTETTSENVSYNVLSGVLENTLTSELTSDLGTKIYVLNGGQSAGIGFYPYSKDATLTANKAYYKASSQSARDFYLFGSDDSATGIEGLSEDVDNQNETFDNTRKVLLDGKVVVVRNGKKYSITGQIYK